MSTQLHLTLRASHLSDVIHRPQQPLSNFSFGPFPLFDPRHHFTSRSAVPNPQFSTSTAPVPLWSSGSLPSSQGYYSLANDIGSRAEMFPNGGSSPFVFPIPEMTPMSTRPAPSVPMPMPMPSLFTGPSNPLAAHTGPGILPEVRWHPQQGELTGAVLPTSSSTAPFDFFVPGSPTGSLQSRGILSPSSYGAQVFSPAPSSYSGLSLATLESDSNTAIYGIRSKGTPALGLAPAPGSGSASSHGQLVNDRGTTPILSPV